jgi:hypothetical protein
VKQAKLHPQRFLNGEVHDWYRIILGYSDHLVGGLLDEFALDPKGRILDPFCGSGTTLVEGMKRGLRVTGIDANPSSCFAAQVKTNWDIDPELLRKLLPQIRELATAEMRRNNHESDAFYKYLDVHRYIRRWISIKPLKKVISIRRAIQSAHVSKAYKDLLMLALVAETVAGSSNVRFGPELYCGKPKRDSAVLSQFEARVIKMCNDLVLVSGTQHGDATVLKGDARECNVLLDKRKKFSALICSPPYPTEHDYTRNSRLELALLGFVKDRDTLRTIKYGMIRSHTKGIYAADDDQQFVSSSVALKRLKAEIDVRAATKTYGFARLYSRVMLEYFGGLVKHFQSVLPYLEPGARCAYVVGDQSSYLQVHIPTADLLAELAVECGFQHVETRQWRTRWSTTMSRNVVENILLLRAPEFTPHRKRRDS